LSERANGHMSVPSAPVCMVTAYAEGVQLAPKLHEG